MAHVERVAASAGAPAFATHALFATHLCFEEFSSASADESAQSPLRPYLASLPKLEGPEARAWGPSVPALRDDAQLETLRGTPTRAAVARRIRVGRRDARGRIFGGGASDDKVPPEVTLERFRWALATILSRATSGEALPYALLPGIGPPQPRARRRRQLRAGRRARDEEARTSVF